MARKGMRFYGRVQGVGFRYRARQAAQRYGLTGLIRNEWDGSVYMELQGAQADISQVLKALYESPYIRIEDIEAENLREIPDERNFRVVGY